MTETKSGKRLTSGGVIKTLIAVVSFAIVAGIALWDTQERISPGPLHPSHVAVAKLQGNEGCAGCHGDNTTSMAEACESCHEPIAEQRIRATGLHGGLAKTLAADCAECHTEHTNGAVALVNSQSFQKTGAEDLQHYTHADVKDFALTDRHEELGCIACHESAFAAALEPKQHRFLGLSQQCGACHEDAHDGAFGNACAECHGQSGPFNAIQAFEHTSAFPLEGSHKAAVCADCHAPDGEFSVTVLTSSPPQSIRQCVACHESPHGEPFLTGVGALASMSQGESCAACHRVEEKGFVLPNATMEARVHTATGFSLDPPHDKVACSDCHEGPAKETGRVVFASLYPGRRPEQCAVCHEDPHRGQFANGFSGGECLVCHAATRFEPPAFDATMHAKTDFALTGAHARVGCQSCHTADSEGFVDFVSTRDACAACHNDVHHRAFDEPGRPAVVGDRTGCARCHTTDRFAAVQWSAADHKTWTGYALQGAHAQAACTDCHTPVRAGRARFTVLSQSCATCHADPHRGVFDADGRRAAVDGREGCARCHTPNTFEDTTWSADDHGQWTGFALKGAHASVACASCHRPSGDGRRDDHTAGVEQANCAACHTDPHLGQFTVGGQSDCARCHQNPSRFADITFDHQRDSRFKPDAFHAALDCATCHRTYTLDSGAAVVRYRPLGTACQDCHTVALRETVK